MILWCSRPTHTLNGASGGSLKKGSVGEGKEKGMLRIIIIGGVYHRIE
jgi:hypothetical protein